MRSQRYNIVRTEVTGWDSLRHCSAVKDGCVHEERQEMMKVVFLYVKEQLRCMDFCYWMDNRGSYPACWPGLEERPARVTL